MHDHSKTIVFDIDATLADYSGGWSSNSIIPGKPIEESIKQVRRLKEAGYIVGILTTSNKPSIVNWLMYYKLEDLFDFINKNPDQPPNTNEGKPIAHCYIDDRAARFDGTNMEKIVTGIINGDLDSWQKE
jgi:hydroxymethylpyrimidine pyrophosphatase-like HAD family hydrolase